MSSYLFKLIDFFLAKEIQDKDIIVATEQLRKIRLTIVLLLGISSFGILMFFVRQVIGQTHSPTLPMLLVGPIITVGSLFISKRLNNYNISSFMLLLLATIIIWVRIYATGGITSPDVMWITCLPMIAILITDIKMAIIVTMLSASFLVFLLLAKYFGVAPATYIPNDNVSFGVSFVFFGFITAYVWLTDRERAFFAKNIRDAERKLVDAEKLASIGQIASGAAHEINNPLAIIRGNMLLLEMLLSDKEGFNQRVRKSFSSVEKMIIRITNIVKYLDLYNSYQNNKFLYKQVLLNDLFDSIIRGEEFLNIIPENMHLNIDQKDLKVIGDTELLRQAFISLVDNIIDFYGDDKTSSEIYINVLVNNSKINILLANKNVDIENLVFKNISETYSSNTKVFKDLVFALHFAESILKHYDGGLVMSLDDKTMALLVTF